MNQKFAVLSLLAMMLAACAGDLDLGQNQGNGPAGLPFPECRANSYDFVGRGTFAELGLDKATPVPPPDPNRIAMIWVTHDLLPYDRGEPGGPVEMTRMMCFEFADGSGGSQWPVDAAWQAPGPDSGLDDEGSAVSLPVSVLAAVALGAVLIAASLAAFRKKRS